MREQRLTGIYTAPILFNANKILLFMAILLAPLRAYSLATIADFNLSFYRTAWLLVIIVAVLEWLQKRAKIIVSSSTRVLASMIITMIVSWLISFVVSPNIYVSDTVGRFAGKIFGWLFIVLFLSLASSTFRIIESATKAFILSSCIPLVIGAYQLGWFVMKGSFPSLPFAKFSVGGISTTLSGVVYWHYPRIMSTFLEPNYFGLFLSITALIVLSSLLFTRPSMKPLLPRSVLWLVLFLCLIELIFTLSLSSMLGFVGGILVISFFALKYRVRAWIRAILFTAVFIFAAQTLFFQFFDVNLVQMMHDRFSIRMESTSTLFGREQYYSAAAQAFALNPLIGGGLGRLIDYEPGSVSSAHSAFLTCFGEQGFLGFLTLVGFFIYVIMILYGRIILLARRQEIPKLAIGVGLLAATIAVILTNVFYDTMFSLDSSWVMIGIVAAYVSFPIRIAKVPAHDNKGIGR